VPSVFSVVDFRIFLHWRVDFSLKTNQTTLEFRFPPQAVHDLKDGDHISVDMAYSKGS